MLDISEKAKSLFRDDFITKDIKIHFPNGEREDILTKDIYGDGSSISFTESICSQSNLKFGLSEKSILQFETVDVENISGYEIEASAEVIDPDTGETVSVPYGRFVVDSCKKQSDMRLRKVIAYSGKSLEVSLLTLAKLSLPSLNSYSYRVDIDELMGTNERLRGRFSSAYKTEFTGHTQGVDIDSIGMNAAYIGSDGYLYTIYCSVEYKYKTVKMYAYYGGAIPMHGETWYDIQSEIVDVNEAGAWDSGIRDIMSYLDMLKSIVVYQNDERRQKLDDTLQWCDTYLNNYVVRMDVLQTYKKKKLRTSKDVIIAMDDMGDGIRRSRYVSSAVLDVVNERGSTTSNASGSVIIFDTAADGTLTFMCPYSIEVRVERQQDSGSSETVFNRSIVSGRKDILLDYGSLLKRHTMEYQTPTIYQPQLPIKVAFPDIQFERTEGADGYYWCKDIEKDLDNAVSAAAEIQAKFVHLDRYGVCRFVGISDNFGLYPEETLYPAEDLYPNENNGGLVTTYDYSTLWYEDYEVQPYGTVIVNYKNMSGNDEVLTYKFNRANKNVYHFKDNFIFKSGGWKPSEIRSILDAWFIPGLLGIRYTPIELEMKGLPYIEAGDVLTVLTRTGGIEAFVFRRTLKGINHMTDTIEAKGDELNEADIDDSITIVKEV